MNRCSRCGFKFTQPFGPGRKAQSCPSCRKDRDNKWRKDQEAKTKKPTPKVVEDEENKL